jgi:plasmid maintenance system antidote protein VapI
LEHAEDGYKVSLHTTSDESETVKSGNIFRSLNEAFEAELKMFDEVQKDMEFHRKLILERLELDNKRAAADSKKLQPKEEPVPEDEDDEEIDESEPYQGDGPLVELACKVTKYLENNGPKKRGAIAKSLRDSVKNIQEALDILIRDDEVTYEERGRTYAISDAFDVSLDSGLAEIAAPEVPEEAAEEPDGRILYNEILEALKAGPLNARAIAQTLVVNPERITPILTILQDHSKITTSNGFWKLQQPAEEHEEESSFEDEMLDAIVAAGKITITELTEQFGERDGYIEARTNLFLRCEIGLADIHLENPVFWAIGGNFGMTKDNVIAQMKEHRKYLWNLINEKKTITLEEACLNDDNATVEWSLLQTATAAFALEEAGLIAIDGEDLALDRPGAIRPLYLHFLHQMLNRTVDREEFCEENNLPSDEFEAMVARTVIDGF